ncbi:MAG: hypothetical protein Q4A62_05640 [Eikenella sp.]|nr:hypothetical protein [Eikenella sp.]
MKTKLLVPALALAALLSGCVVIDGSDFDSSMPAKYRTERLHQSQNFRCDNGFNTSIYRQTVDYADFYYGVGSDRTMAKIKPMSSSSGEYSVSDDNGVQWRQYENGEAKLTFSDRNGRQTTTCRMAR